jgi:uncharacterized protein
MAGETDLAVLLRSMTPQLNQGAYVYTQVPRPIPGDIEPIAMIHETEGWTLILRREQADELGLPYDYIAAWITLQVHSALQAVGLTAAVSSALAAAAISANIVAGYFHDHLFVPYERADKAIEVLTALAGGD